MASEVWSAEGFRGAITLATYNGAQIWRAFAAFVGTNAFLVGLSAFVIAFIPSLVPVAGVILAAFGFITCMGWFVVISREFGYLRYYFAWARFYEHQLEVDRPGMVQLGAHFADGNPVTAGSETQKQGWWARLFKVHWVMVAVIVMFAVVYAFVFWYSLFGLSVQGSDSQGAR